jgi:hypothetical protein
MFLLLAIFSFKMPLISFDRVGIFLSSICKKIYNWFYKKSLIFLKVGNFFFVAHVTYLYLSNAFEPSEYHPTWNDFIYFISDKVLIFTLFLANCSRPKNKWFRYEIIGMAIFSFIRIIYAVGEMISWDTFNSDSAILLLGLLSCFMFGFIIFYNMALAINEKIMKLFK